MWILLDVVFFELHSSLLIELVWIDSLILVYRVQSDRNKKHILTILVIPVVIILLVRLLLGHL